MRRIPTITKNLLIINILLFIAMWVFDSKGVDINNMFGLHFFLAPNFNITQLVTYMFLHANLEHLFFNMFALWMFGCVIENMFGAKRFLIYYLTCGIGAGVVQEVAQFGELYALASSQISGFSISDIMKIAHNSAPVLSGWTTVGASGAVYSILLAFGMMLPNERIFIFPLPIPIKAKWFVCIYIFIELFSAVNTSNSHVAHFAHLGGMLFGWLIIKYWRGGHGNAGYNYGGQSMKDKIKDFLNKLSSPRKKDNTWVSNSTSRNSDWDYNTKRKEREEEIDRILDKVRRSGYESLSEEEKRKLFDGGSR